MKKMNKKGFTIVELVIVIAVIGILATVLIPTFGNVIKNAQDESFRLAARNAFVEHTATTPADLAADFIYVDGDKFAAINDGKLVTSTVDGQEVVTIYTAYADAATAAELGNAGEGKVWSTPAENFKGLFKPASENAPAPAPAG